jgi:hypothetical protein
LAHRISLREYAAICFVLSFAFLAFSYPANRWRYLRTRHFEIAFNSRTEHMAWKVNEIADDMAEKLQRYFGYAGIWPKTSIVLRDDADIPNGYASRLRHLVVIDCRNTPVLWRSQRDWLTTVLAHELSHIITKEIISRRFFLNMYANVESESAGIDGSVGTFFERNPLPMWFAEGVAQAGETHRLSVRRDPMRDMLLCDAFLSNRLLSMRQMGRFEGTAREYELAYNQGYSMVLYMQEAYPHIRMDTLCLRIADEGFPGAIHGLYGMSMGQLYRGWQQSLAGHFAGIKPYKGSYVFNKKNKPFIAEITSANAKYVVANWHHDYRRFDLFSVPQPGIYRRIARDTGPFVAYDRSSQSLWYTRYVYNHRSGIVQSDLYKRTKKGRSRRITRGERCIAFDVRDGVCVYASYNNGKTSITKMGKASRIRLHAFPYDTSVHRISIMENGIIALSIQTRGKYKVVFLEDNFLGSPFEGVNADMLDAAAAGADTLLFVSTLGKTPQLYWCDLAANAFDWYCATSYPGVRYPVAQRHASATEVYCSVLSNGHFRIAKLNSPFVQSNKALVSASEDSAAWKKRYTSEIEPDSVFRTPQYMPLALPYLALGFEVGEEIMQGSENSSVEVGPAAQVGMAIEDAPSSFELGVEFGIRFASEAVQAAVGRLAFKTWIERDIWQLRPRLSFASTRYYDVFYEDSVQRAASQPIMRYADVDIYYEINDKNLISAGYERKAMDMRIRSELTTRGYYYSASNSDEMTTDFECIYRSRLFACRWYFNTGPWLNDPARLGGESISARAVFKAGKNMYPVKDTLEYFSPQRFLLDPVALIYSKGGFAAAALLGHGKIGLSAGVDGFAYFGTSKGDKVAPYTYEYVGKNDLFSGYENAAVYAMQMGRLAPEIRMNPFVDNRDKTAGYERWHIALKAEAGPMKYFDDSLVVSGWPVSVETAFRFYWYMRPSAESMLYFKYAIPITDITAEDERNSFRIYFGLSL